MKDFILEEYRKYHDTDDCKIFSQFEIYDDGFHEIPPIKIFKKYYTSRGVKYGSSVVFLINRNEYVDTRNIDETLKVATLVEDDKELEEYKRIEELCLIEEAKRILSNKT